MTNPPTGFSFDAPLAATGKDKPEPDESFDATHAHNNSTTATTPPHSGEHVDEGRGGADDPATSNEKPLTSAVAIDAKHGQDPLDIIDAAPHHTDTAATAQPGAAKAELLDTIDEAPQIPDPSSTFGKSAAPETDGDLDTTAMPSATTTASMSDTGAMGSPRPEDDYSPPHEDPTDVCGDPALLDTAEAAEGKPADAAAHGEQNHHITNALPAADGDSHDAANPEQEAENTDAETPDVVDDSTARGIHSDSALRDNDKAATNGDAANDAPSVPRPGITVDARTATRNDEPPATEPDTAVRAEPSPDTSAEQTRPAATSTESSQLKPETSKDCFTPAGTTATDTAAAAREAVTDAATDQRGDDPSATAEADGTRTEPDTDTDSENPAIDYGCLLNDVF
ncbi:hypothetical protein, partial [Amycolatopsis lurida]|uniref:hypothetical protein n=1 Tax=Amycolatopsis lurida TaxID=31959 RepID=UPI003652C39E